MQIKLIFTRKALHLASFWKWEFLELQNGLLIQNALWCVINTQSSEGSLRLITEQVLIFFLLLRFLPQWMSLFLLTETYHCVNLQFSFVNIIRYWSCLTPGFSFSGCSWFFGFVVAVVEIQTVCTKRIRVPEFVINLQIIALTGCRINWKFILNNCLSFSFILQPARQIILR